VVLTLNCYCATRGQAVVRELEAKGHHHIDFRDARTNSHAISLTMSREGVVREKLARDYTLAGSTTPKIIFELDGSNKK
jgi:hypothetical protein